MESEAPYPYDHQIYDLKLFLKGLDATPRFKKIRGLLSKMAKWGSAQNDLKLAGQYLVTAGEIDRARKVVHGVKPGFEMLPLGSLQLAAAIFYARATSPARGGETRYTLEDKISGEDRHWHNVIVNLRNSGMAHFGAGPNPAAPWSDDALILRVTPGTRGKANLKMFAPPLRVSHSSEIMAALGRMIPLAISHIDADFDKATDAFYDEYEQLCRSGSAVRNALRASPWDPRTLYRDNPHDHIVEAILDAEGVVDYPSTISRYPQSLYGPDETPN